MTGGGDLVTAAPGSSYVHSRLLITELMTLYLRVGSWAIRSKLRLYDCKRLHSPREAAKKWHCVFLITEAKSSFVDHNLRIQLGKTSADERTSRIDVSDTSTQINAVQCHYIHTENVSYNKRYSRQSHLNGVNDCWCCCPESIAGPHAEPRPHSERIQTLFLKNCVVLDCLVWSPRAPL